MRALSLWVALAAARASSLFDALEHSLCFDQCDLTDQVGNWDATLQNGANCSRGVGVAFDGVDDYVDLALGRARVVDVGGAMTLAFWTRWDTVAWWSMLCNFGDGANVDNIVVSRYQNGAQLRFGVAIGAAWERTSGGAIVQGAWTHVLVTTANRTLRLYQDGALASENADGHAPRRLNRTNHWLGRSDAGNYWSGAVASVHAWSRALNASEVAALHARGRGRCVTPPTPLPTPPPSPAPSPAPSERPTPAPSGAPTPAPTHTTVLAAYLIPPSAAQQPTTVARLRDGSTFASKVLKPHNGTATFFLMNNNPAPGGGAGGARLWGECRFGALERVGADAAGGRSVTGPKFDSI